MSTYLPEQNLLFIHSPYTASRSVSECLEQLGGKRISTKMHMGVQESLDAMQRDVYSRKPTEVEGNVEFISGGVTLFSHKPETKPRCFTTVRHPFDTLTSMFLQNQVDDFRTYLEEGCPKFDVWFPQIHLEFLEEVDEFIRFENLEEDLSNLLGKKVTLSHTGKTPNKKNYREYYDETTVRLATDYVSEYFDRTGYSPNELGTTQTRPSRRQDS